MDKENQFIGPNNENGAIKKKKKIFTTPAGKLNKSVVKTKARKLLNTSRGNAAGSMSVLYKQSLKANNKSLARALDVSRQDSTALAKRVLELEQEKQELVAKNSVMKNLTDKSNASIEEELQRRMQVRMERIRRRLEAAATCLHSAGDELHEAVRLCDEKHIHDIDRVCADRLEMTALPTPSVDRLKAPRSIYGAKCKETVSVIAPGQVDVLSFVNELPPLPAKDAASAEERLSIVTESDERRKSSLRRTISSGPDDLNRLSRSKTRSRRMSSGASVDFLQTIQSAAVTNDDVTSDMMPSPIVPTIADETMEKQVIADEAVTVSPYLEPIEDQPTESKPAEPTAIPYDEIPVGRSKRLTTVIKKGTEDAGLLTNGTGRFFIELSPQQKSSDLQDKKSSVNKIDRRGTYCVPNAFSALSPTPMLIDEGDTLLVHSDTEDDMQYEDEQPIPAIVVSTLDVTNIEPRSMELTCNSGESQYKGEDEKKTAHTEITAMQSEDEKIKKKKKAKLVAPEVDQDSSDSDWAPRKPRKQEKKKKMPRKSKKNASESVNPKTDQIVRKMEIDCRAGKMKVKVGSRDGGAASYRGRKKPVVKKSVVVPDHQIGVFDFQDTPPPTSNAYDHSLTETLPLERMTLTEYTEKQKLLKQAVNEEKHDKWDCMNETTICDSEESASAGSKPMHCLNQMNEDSADDAGVNSAAAEPGMDKKKSGRVNKKNNVPSEGDHTPTTQKSSNQLQLPVADIEEKEKKPRPRTRIRKPKQSEAAVESVGVTICGVQNENCLSEKNNPSEDPVQTSEEPTTMPALATAREAIPIGDKPKPTKRGRPRKDVLKVNADMMEVSSKGLDEQMSKSSKSVQSKQDGEVIPDGTAVEKHKPVRRGRPKKSLKPKHELINEVKSQSLDGQDSNSHKMLEVPIKVLKKGSKSLKKSHTSEGEGISSDLNQLSPIRPIQREQTEGNASPVPFDEELCAKPLPHVTKVRKRKVMPSSSSSDSSPKPNRKVVCENASAHRESVFEVSLGSDRGDVPDQVTKLNESPPKRTRRAAANKINFKEPSLNAKMRREDK